MLVLLPDEDDLEGQCSFKDEEQDIRCVVHGDDFTFLGTDSALTWIQKRMQARYKVKVKGRLGPQPRDDEVIKILNRVVEWTPQGIRYECDQRHAEIIFREMGLSSTCAAVSTPGVKMKVESTKIMTQSLTPNRDQGTGDW